MEGGGKRERERERERERVSELPHVDNHVMRGTCIP